MGHELALETRWRDLHTGLDMDVVAAAFHSEPEADGAMDELSSRLGLPAGSLQKAALGRTRPRMTDRFVVAGQIPASAVPSAGTIIRRHHGRIVAKVASR
jgi:hypothetical protein